MFDKNNFEYVNGKRLDDNGNVVSDANSSYSLTLISVKPNTTYTIQGTQSEQTKSTRIYYYNNQKQFISRTRPFATDSYSFTTLENCYYIGLQLRNSTYINVNIIQLEQGSTATDYVPHQEQNYPFTFAEGQRAMQGTQLLDDGIHNNRNRVNLWEQTIVNGMAFGNYYRYQIDISDARTYSTNVGSTALCNCFYMDIDALSSADAKIGMFAQFRDTQGFYFISDKSNTTEFIAELTENNAVLEYELAEEEIIPYNETQQEQYNAMKQAISYNDITYIETSSDELQPTLDVQYWKKKTE